jgi:hypothetical protein
MEQPKPNSSNTALIIGIIVLLCVICAIIIGLGGYFYSSISRNFPLTPGLPFPNDTAEPANPQPPVTVTRPPVDAIPTETVETLARTIVPSNDLYELACRLKGICDVPTTLPAPATPLKVGDKQTFWVTNVDTTDNFQINATLRYITAHSYFWAQDGVSYDQNDMKKLMDTFENKMYPTDREFFGSEWTPGVDNDQHIYIVFTRGTGASNAGYFSTPDEYNPLVHKYSNGHEMFMFNADNMDLGAEDTYSTLAHEFQHMIHWKLDANETSWMNEGFSVLAEFLNDYSVFFDYYYVSSPDLSLNDWLPDPGANGPHYGESFLYLAYFLDRFGEDATKALAKDPENSLTSVDDTLKALNITDPETGNLITADDVFMDWAVALFLKDGSVGDGRFTYHNYPDAPTTSETESVPACPQSAFDRAVSQYGIDYIDIACSGDYSLSFTGSTLAGLLPVDAHSGTHAFWSNKGDQSDMLLTREFDFTNASAPIVFSYSTWYDLEQDYDYLYLEASTDGKTWQIVTTPSGTDQDKSGNSYGWGYNGLSGGGNSAEWIQEDVDLSQFAGKKVQLRFEYVTDAAVNGEGLLLDDLSIDAINYQSDFETDEGGWKGDGFARIENALPQTFRLALITFGDKTTVQTVPVNPDQTAEVALSLKPGEHAVLVVTGTTRFTRIPAAYTIEIK